MQMDSTRLGMTQMALSCALITNSLAVELCSRDCVCDKLTCIKNPPLGPGVTLIESSSFPYSPLIICRALLSTRLGEAKPTGQSP